jgi:hypothetical protein
LSITECTDRVVSTMQCPEVVDVGSSRQSVNGRPFSPTLVGEELRNRLATVVIAKLRG